MTDAQIHEEAARWAKAVEALLPMFFRDCNTLDDLASWLRRLAQATEPA